MAAGRGAAVLLACSYFLLFVGNCRCDTPANCTYSEVEGTWKFSIVDEKDENKPVNSNHADQASHSFQVKLSFPNIAIDELGNKGTWTMVYNQGFEVIVHGRKYFAFSKYEGSGENVTSICDETMRGWSHGVLGHHWAYFYGSKLQKVPRKVSIKSQRSFQYDRLYRRNDDFIARINSVQNSWQAVHYPEHEQFTLGDIYRRNGGQKSAYTSPKPGVPSEEVKKAVASLPSEWDWTNVDGTSFVSPVRNQASCGSCFAFASVGMNEARLRVMTKNRDNMTFSPQDVVECSPYSQGCEGGFPYLVAGKYAEDFGLVPEECNPYKGKDGSCSTKPDCFRSYSTQYRYVGGYYGACNVEEMQLALYQNGPLAISFEVYGDFMNYKGGVYQHTGLEDRFNPFEVTNHAVLLVGWGTDAKSDLDFWKVKNSWGENWGEKGYFRIRRGVDECSIESIAVESFKILP